MPSFIGSGGHYLTKGLFYEFRYQCNDPDAAAYTLNENDIVKNDKPYKSMYKLYMQCDTEYEAAKLLLDSWPHWVKLADSSWFKPYLEKWREEREIKEIALGKSVLIKESESGNASAAKALIEFNKKQGAGRPTKAKVQAEIKKKAAIDTKVSSLLERMADK